MPKRISHYSGRFPISESLIATGLFREAILKKLPVSALEVIEGHEGMQIRWKNAPNRDITSQIEQEISGSSVSASPLNPHRCQPETANWHRNHSISNFQFRPRFLDEIARGGRTNGKVIQTKTRACGTTIHFPKSQNQTFTNIRLLCPNQQNIRLCNLRQARASFGQRPGRIRLSRDCQKRIGRTPTKPRRRCVIRFATAGEGEAHLNNQLNSRQ